MCFGEANAYEYIKLNELFKALQADYAATADFKNISLNGLKALTAFDEEIRLYNSDSKAFLYEANNLIGEFELPKENENPAQWHELLTTVLETSAERSPKINGNEKELEAQILNIMAQSLDKYSRAEANTPLKAQVRSEFKQNILYIYPQLFAHGTADEIKKTIAAYPQADGVILDLRGNRGGDLNEAIKTTDLFLDGALIASSEDKSRHQYYYTATAGDILAGKPLAVLTDKNTASAAELVAAALGEQSRAVLIGTKTYGKGSIQNVYHIKNQTLFLTSGYFFTPSGKRINGDGILPQICTGINDSCFVPDKANPTKDIQTAIRLIKKNLG